MKTWTGRQILTYNSLFILLVGRIFAEGFVTNFLLLLNAPILSPSWVFEIGLVQDWVYNLFLNWSFVLVAIIIIVNRGDLKGMNIDWAFMTLFIVGSLVYWVYYRWTSGWIVLLVPFVIYILYKKQKFKFGKTEPIAGRMTIVLVVGFVLGLFLLRYDLLTIRNILWVTHSFATQFPFTLVEEVIFRGLLWKFLTDINWPAPKIVVTQAFLFWLSHSRYMNTDPAYFWVAIPIASIILGIIVWRTGSITVSLFAHIFYNFLS